MRVTLNTAGQPPSPLLHSLFHFRGYIFTNALQDFLHRYTGTAMGLLWNAIHPIMMVIVFSVVFTFVIPSRFGMEGFAEVPFVVFLCSALLPWLCFVDALQRATSCFVENASYLRKLPIPEEVFLAKAVVGSSILLGVNLVALVVTAVAFGVTPRASWLLVPLVGGMLMVLAFGLGALLGTVNVFARDVAQILSITTQLWMWLTPIVYSSQAMPPGLRSLQYANPMYPFVELIRTQFLFGTAGALRFWLLALAWMLLTVAAGSAMLRRFRSDLRDVL
jgi:lipopolysaccharide transport system permease protein